MTAQPQAWDQAVLANEGLFQGILEAAPDAVVIVDRDGIIRIVNGQTEKLFGYSRAELLGSSVDQLVPEPLQETHAAHRERYLADARTRPMGVGLDLRARRKDGTEIPVEISLSPLNLDDGRPLVIAIVRDITERHELLRREQEARAAAEAAVRTRDQVLSTVTHDLRTPLAAISLYAQALPMRAGSGDVALKQILDEPSLKIGQAAKDGLVMIEELLDAARLTMGESLQLDRRQVDLAALVDEAVIRHQETASQHRLVFEGPSDAVLGLWDAPRLRRVINNLLSNATKYSAPGSRVSVGVMRETQNGETWAVTSVSDEGPGIPEEDLPHLFEWFWRGKNVKGRHGSGLGLAGARRIAELHGGTIDVESQVGAGSTFIVKLPL